MADNHFESGGNEERVWDEYDWERFLQQQDRKTEKYMELLEKYLDDPNRDQIIAREMGWHHLLDESTGKDWAANLDNLFAHNQRSAKADEETKTRRKTKTTKMTKTKTTIFWTTRKRTTNPKMRTRRKKTPPTSTPATRSTRRPAHWRCTSISFSTSTTPPPSTRPPRA